MKESPIPLAALYNPTLNLVKGNYRLTSDLESPIAIKLDSKHEYQYSTSQGQYSHKLLKSTATKHVYAGDTLSGYHETQSQASKDIFTEKARFVYKLQTSSQADACILQRE